jgi:hypothetical protein
MGHAGLILDAHDGSHNSLKPAEDIALPAPLSSALLLYFMPGSAP